MTVCDSQDPREKLIETNLYKVVRYEESLRDAWENMVAASMCGTLLHTRKFLSYHGSKFDDQSLLIYDGDDILRAVFPAACDPTDSTIIVSHPGITYGGLLHDGWLRGQRCLDLFMQIRDFYARAGLREILYKAVPCIYHRIPSQEDIYALFRLGAQRYRVDLSATVDLQNRGPIAQRRTRTQKRQSNLVCRSALILTS